MLKHYKIDFYTKDAIQLYMNKSCIDFIYNKSTKNTTVICKFNINKKYIQSLNNIKIGDAFNVVISSSIKRRLFILIQERLEVSDIKLNISKKNQTSNIEIKFKKISLLY